MSWNARRASIVLLPLILTISAFWLEPGRAQDKAVVAPAAPPAAATPPARQNANMNPDGFLNNGIHLVKDEKRRSDQIQAALDYISDEKWDVAVQRLQKLLEIDEDVFVRLKRKNAEGDDVFIWVSAKQEADRLIGALPAAGKDFYNATFGAKAAELLKKAKKNGDPGLLNDIMKKYAHTEAGAEAIKLLGDYKFDRGEYMPALLCYSKLINRLGEEKTPVAMLAKAAWAAHLAPPSSSDKNTVTAAIVFSEKELWKMLRARTREIPFGDQTIAVEDLQEHVAKLDRTRLEQNATDSLLYRATISRSNQLTGGPAFMAREWGTSLLYEKEGDDSLKTAGMARRYIRQAKTALKTQNQPIIPAFSPITLSVLDSKGEKKPLLIYKNFFGVMATDLRNGSLAWMSPSSWSLQRMLGQGGSKQNSVGQWLTYYQSQHPQILFENSTVGTLSTDGQFVYVVEDLAVPPDPQPNIENGMVFRGGMMQNPASMDKDLEDAVSHNRLYALSLTRSGALTWALGDDEKDPLRDHYFLGPPLPLAGKLYVLADKQQEIRLICLDPAVLAKDSRNVQAAIVSTQTLGMTQEKMQHDALRRTWAAHLAYGEGILVCPTNAGAVFGVNLLENSLVWAYPYRDKNDAKEQPQPQWNGRGGIRQWPPPGFVIGPDGRPVPISNAHHNHWKVSAPVISDGKVVFTAPDARSIHCINLRDGSPLWKRPKLEEDLYLGNVYNGKVLIVGKKSVRALTLSTGEPAWDGPLPTGTPSGQGIGSDNIYYLPLKDTGKSRDEPQIVGIDIDKGKIVSSSKAQTSASDKNDADVPGNLLFAEGKVISVSPFMKGESEEPEKKCEGEVVAYPQLKVKISEMDDKIAKNSNDASALTERGELRLDKGDLSGAIDDLSTALQNHPSKEIREKARAKLYDTLTAYIENHFNEAERYLDEYERLCRIDLDAAPQSQRRKLEDEQRLRRSKFLWLVGKGREEQGRLVEAFEKYQQFADEAGKQSELVPAVDDRQVKAAPDVWSRGRIIAMMNNAKPENRQPLENLIADKWKKLRDTNDLKALRSFVRMFGSASDAGKEARLELVERLMEQKDSGEEHPLLEAELELNQFRTGKHTPELAARATEALARLYTRKGLLEDAAYCYRKLGKEYAKIVIRDGKTGQQIYDDEAATDKRLLPYLDDPLPLGSVKGFRYKNDSGDFPPPYRGQLFQFEQSGEKLPYFRRHIIGLNLSDHRFLVLDRNLENENHTPREVWSPKLSSTAFETLSRSVLGHQQQDQMMNARMARMGAMPGMPINPNHNPNVRFPYSTVGHLIVLPVAHRVFGIDPVNRHILWEKDLSEGVGVVSTQGGGRGPSVNVNLHPLVVDPRDGSVLVTYTDNWAQRLGQVSPFQGQTICVQSANRLTALDPLSGRTLWSRMDVNSKSYLFSDEDYVFVVEMDGQNNPSSTRVFRAADGINFKANDFATLFGKRQQFFGRNLLVTETGPSNEVKVRLYDIITGKDVWTQKYPTRSIVAHSEDATLTGIVEPNGKVHVIDLRQRKEVMSGELFEPAERLKNAKAFHLLADRNYFYLASQTTPPNANPQMNNSPPTSVMAHLGMRTVPVSGYLRAFERKTGKHKWDSFISPAQYLILDQFEDSPLLLLSARGGDVQNAGMGGGMGFGGPGMGMPVGNNQMVKVTSIHKSTGLVVCDEKLPNKTDQFYGVRIDPRANTVELLSQHLKITHYPRPNDREKAKAPDEAPRSDGARSLAPESNAAAKKALRPAFDRARIRQIAPPLPPR